MARDLGANDVAASRYDVEKARRQVRRVKALDEDLRLPRRELTRFDHGRAADRERRRQLARYEPRARVPRRDDADHSERIHVHRRATYVSRELEFLHRVLRPEEVIGCASRRGSRETPSP